MTKYAPLTDHLRHRQQSTIPMRFADIESVLGFPLPPSSRHHRAWWSNNPTNNVMTRAWLAAGYQTRDVDIEAERLVFERLNTADAPPAPERIGDHPLLGCMAGTFTIAPGVDLTEPMYTDAEMDAFVERKARLLAGLE